MGGESCTDRILSLFSSERRLTFFDLQRAINAPSNEVARALSFLIRERVLEYTPQGYKIAEKHHAQIEQERCVLPALLLIITDGKRFLLRQRREEGEAHRWSLIHTPLTMADSIESVALREGRAQAGMELELVKVNGLVHKKLLERTSNKQAYLYIACTLEPINPNATTAPGVGWFEADELNQRLVLASDLWIIEHLQREQAHVHELFISEEQDETLNPPRTRVWE